PHFVQIAGPEADRDIAFRIIGRDIGADPREEPAPTDLQESMAKLTARLFPPKAAATLKAPPEVANDNKRPAGFLRTRTDALMQTVFAPIKWVIPGYVPEGLTLLAGKQKLGKTWMAIDWAAAVAMGGRTMGIDCEQGDVLYI